MAWATDAYFAAFRAFMGLIVAGWIPDAITRLGIRYLLGLRLREVRSAPPLLKAPQQFHLGCRAAAPT